MLRSIRPRQERSRNAMTLRRRAPHAAALTLALMMAPHLVDTARAADFGTPVVTRGYLATDTTQICTFWEGLGSYTPFLLTDDNGDPVSWNTWLTTVSKPTYDRFFDTLQGLTFLISPTGQDWLRSPPAIVWAHSLEGSEWLNGFVKSAPEPRPDEYAKICDAYGAGFYYIPGTDTCLRIGGYLRQDGDNAGTPAKEGTPASSDKTFDSVLSDLKPAIGDGLSPRELQLLARILSGLIKSPPPSQPATKQETQTSIPKLRLQRDFGGPGSSSTTTPKTSTQPGGQTTGTVTVRIHVKGHVPEGSPPGPEVPEQLVGLLSGNGKPDLPMFGTPRTAQQENAGSDKEAPQAKTDKNGTAKITIDLSDMNYYWKYNYLEPGVTLKPNATLNTTVYEKKHDSIVVQVGTADPATGLKITASLQLEPDRCLGDISADESYLTISSACMSAIVLGPTEIADPDPTFYVPVNISRDYNTPYNPEQVRKDIVKKVRENLGPNVTVTFDGNVCRIELPARVAGPYTPIPQKPTAGIPEATIKLRLAARQEGGAR